MKEFILKKVHLMKEFFRWTFFRMKEGTFFRVAPSQNFIYPPIIAVPWVLEVANTWGWWLESEIAENIFPIFNYLKYFNINYCYLYIYCRWELVRIIKGTRRSQTAFHQWLAYSHASRTFSSNHFQVPRAHTRQA